MRAAQEMRNVRQCLIESEQKKSKSDLRLIDWHQFGHGLKLDVCLFHIFSSLGSIEKASEWMRYHNLETKVSPELEDESHWLLMARKEPGGKLFLRRVNVRYDTKVRGYLVPRSWFFNWTYGWIWKAYSEHIQSYWTDDGKIMDVGYGANFK